uniref:WIT1/2 N-terminal helical bundle domain-containing protein n=1 Tax=Daucus carota subsp. sativus TaxID=79200 RepID=A0A162A5P8_DAUCS
MVDAIQANYSGLLISLTDICMKPLRQDCATQSVLQVSISHDLDYKVWHSHNIYMAGKDGEDFYVDIGDSESGKNVAREDMSSKDMLDTGNAMEALTRVDLDLAYSSEKSVNLDTLMMHVWAWEKEFEALATDDISVDCIEKALAYDFFSGILESEENALEMKMQLTKLQMTSLAFNPTYWKYNSNTGLPDDSQGSLMRPQLQTAEQRHVLRMLEKSLA